MKRIRLTVLVLCLLLAAGCRGVKDSGNDALVETIGIERLEQLKLENKDKVLVLNVFASWCPPCREEAPGFVEIYNTHDNKDFEIIGLSIDRSKDDLLKFMNRYSISYPVYQITDTVQRRLMADKVPTTFIFAPDGEHYTTVLGAIDGNDLYRVVMFLTQK